MVQWWFFFFFQNLLLVITDLCLSAWTVSKHSVLFCNRMCLKAAGSQIVDNINFYKTSQKSDHSLLGLRGLMQSLISRQGPHTYKSKHSAIASV